MLKTIFPAIVLIMVLGCTSGIDTYLENNTDMVKLRFYALNGDSIDYDYLTVMIESRKEIQKIIGSISVKSRPRYKCGYNGKIEFYNNREILIRQMKFNLNKNCNHIIYTHNGTLYSKKITEPGIRYLSRFYRKIPADKRL